MTNSSVVTGSFSQSSQAAVNLAAGTQTATSGTVIFSNSNNVSFGMSNSSVVTASYTQSNQQMSFYAATNSVLSSSITANASSLVFAGSGAASVGLSSGSVIVSAPNAAAGNVTFSAGSLSGGYASIVFSNSNNMSFGLNGSTITGSVLPIGSLSRTIYPNDQLEAVSAFGNGSLSVQYIPSPGYVSGSRLDALVSWSASSSGASNTAAIAMTAFAGIYTNNASTLSSLSTGSTQTTYTYASNSANWSSINSAMLPISVPININMSPGEYYVGFGFSTNSSSIGLATTNLAQTVSMYGGTQIQSALNYAEWLAGTATSSNLFNMGVLNATATKPPATIALSQLSVTGQYLYRANIAIVIRNY
jgi:hypothetical protein